MHEGLVYIKKNPSISKLLLMMCSISFFGLPLTTFIPAYTKDILNGGSEMLGILMACTGAGSLLAAFYLALHKDTTRLVKEISVSCALLGIILSVLSYTQHAWIAAALLISAGFTIIAAAASINTLLQVHTTDEMRGRIMGYMAMTFTGVNPLGSMFLGALEESWGLPAIILLSGVACFVSAILFAGYHKVLSIISPMKI